MNIVLFSDDHHSNNDPYDLKSFKEQAVRIALQTVAKNDFGVHAGDMFHYRNPDSDTLDWITKIYMGELGDQIYKMAFLAANHDGHNRETTPISPFVNGTRCYGRTPLIIGNKVVIRDKLAMLGWNSNNDIDLVEAKYLVTHARIQEWVFNNPERAFAKAEFETLNLQRVFLGDNHQRKDEGALVSIGSLCPKDFGDKDVKAGFIIFDSDYNEYRRVDIPDYPIFRTVSIFESTEFDPDPKYIKGNIVRLKFIGSHKFVNDKTIRQRWLSKIWLMEPHTVPDPEWEQTNGEEVMAQEELTIEEEIKQVARQQKWPEGTENVALGA